MSRTVLVICFFTCVSACIGGPPAPDGSNVASDMPPDGSNAAPDMPPDESGVASDMPPPPIAFGYVPLPTGTGAMVLGGTADADVHAQHVLFMMRSALDLDTRVVELASDPADLSSPDLTVFGQSAAFGTDSPWATGLQPHGFVTFEPGNWSALGFAENEVSTTTRKDARIRPSAFTAGWEMDRALGVYLGERVMNHVAPPAETTTVLEEPDSAEAVMLASEEPRRVAVGLQEVEDVNVTGFVLIADALEWALGRAAPSVRYRCEHIREGYEFEEFVLARRMERNGCDNELASDSGGTVEPFDSGDPAMVLVGPTALEVPVELREYEGPVMVVSSRRTPLEQLGLLTGEDFAAGESVDGTWSIVDSGDTSLTAGQSGEVKISTSSLLTGYRPADIAPGAYPIASLSGSERLGFWILEKGAELVDGSPAAGPRAVLVVPDSLEDVTPEGLRFVDAAFQWAFAHDSR